jgi:hypothetical protein
MTSELRSRVPLFFWLGAEAEACTHRWAETYYPFTKTRERWCYICGHRAEL